MLRSAESEMVRLISGEIIFAEFEFRTYVITIPQRHRQTDRRTDRRTTCHGNTALRVASRGKNAAIKWSKSNPQIFCYTFINIDSVSKFFHSAIIFFLQFKDRFSSLFFFIVLNMFVRCVLLSVPL